MDLFLLAAVGKLGLVTYYQLKQGAALEPGSIRVSLARLISRGFLARPDANGRDPRPMELTGPGEEHLREHWREVLEPDKEMESVLRAATLGLVMASTSTASTFLEDAASCREHLSGPSEVSAVRLRTGAVEFHGEARAIYERRRRVFEAQFLRELARNLIDGSTNEKSVRATTEMQP